MTFRNTMMALAAPILAVALFAGCSTAPKPMPADADYLAMFNAGRYTDALATATRAADAAKGTARDMPALIAGQSAYRVGRRVDALRWLSPLRESRAPGVAGSAAATLGSLARDRGDHAQAAALFEEAAGKLAGDDAARALMYAGDSREALGDHARAQEHYAHARDKALSDVQLRVQIGDRLAGVPSAPNVLGSPSGGYTVQAGAFAERGKAEALAARVRAHGATRIVPIAANGRTLYSVRVGQFSVKSDADRVCKAVGSGAFVTSWVPE